LVDNVTFLKVSLTSRFEGGIIDVQGCLTKSSQDKVNSTLESQHTKSIPEMAYGKDNGTVKYKISSLK
jgi:hypothetical protein